MKKIRIIIMILTSIIIFVGAQIHPASTSGEVQSIYEAFVMALIMFIIQYLFISDFMFNSLREHGLDIEYKFFQTFGLLVILFIFYIVFSAYVYYPNI